MNFLILIHEAFFAKMEKALADAVEMAAKAPEEREKKKKAEKNHLKLFLNFNARLNLRFAI